MFSNKSSHDVRSLRPLVLGGPLEAARKANRAAQEPAVTPLASSEEAAPDLAASSAVGPAEDLLEPVAGETEQGLGALETTKGPDNAHVTFKPKLSPGPFSEASRKAEKTRAAAEAKKARADEKRAQREAKTREAEARLAQQKAALDTAKADRAAVVQAVEEAIPAAPAPEITTAPTALEPGAAPLPFWARMAFPVAIVTGLAWAGALTAFCAGYQNRFGAFEYRPFPVILFASLALLPFLFMLLTAYALRQTAKMAAETRRARDMATELSLPTALAAGQAGGAAEAVRIQIERAGSAAEAAERQLLNLRQALAEESERLIAAAGEAERTAEALTAGLAREREEMSLLSSGLEARAAAVGEAIERQTKMVTEASDLAAVQLQEAEAALAARATDLAAAAGEAGEAAELAGEALSKQADRLDMSSERIAAKLEGVGAKLSTTLEATRLSLVAGHDQLAALAAKLEADQALVADSLERQRQSVAAAAADAEAGASALAAAGESGAASLRDLIAEAAEQVRILTEASQAEQAALDARARAALGLFTGAVAEERAAMEKDAQEAIAALSAFAADTRRLAAENVEAAERTAAAQAEAARAQVEQLGEAAFAAGQKADQGFEHRISAARKTIEAAASLVEDAGQKSVERIEAGLGAAREALGELQTLLEGVDQRLAEAPEQAKAHADKVRETVEASLELITAAARKASAETQGVDAAFQERVKRNYEILAEALRTMGKVASAVEQSAVTTPAAAPAARPQPAAQRPTTLADAPLRLEPGNPAAGERGIRAPGLAGGFAPPAQPAAAPAPRAPVRAEADELGLRPRLRLTPAPQIAPEAPEVSVADLDSPIEALLTSAPVSMVEPRPAPAGTSNRDEASNGMKDDARDGGWTWKDLLSSIDEPPIDDEVLAERLISEIEALGLDAAALLPLSRIDEIAAVMQSGDQDGVRAVVRTLAPGAVRRLSRRVLTDKVLRSHADRYVRRYEDLLHDSQRRDREGFMTAALLGSGPGRAFLLFDAAVGELH